MNGSLNDIVRGLAEGRLVGNYDGVNLLITYLGGDGNDVTLLTAMSGDFDIEGDVDGFDLLMWQRGKSPTPFSASDRAHWEANYSTTSPVSASRGAVPEPTSLALLCLGGLLAHRRIRRATTFAA